jgi:polyisoprenoid-binding protein YceI
MEKLFLTALFCSCCFSRMLSAQDFTPADKGSSVKFLIKNFGFNVEGSIRHFKGGIRFDPNNLGQANIMVSAEVATIGTGNDSRDKHLKKAEYFDAATYPEIKFVSEKIEKASTANGYIVVGKFLIKGKTKAVSIPFTATRQSAGWLFTGTVGLNRRDFGVGGNSVVLSDTLTLVISLFASQ